MTVNVLMVGTGEYTTGWVHDRAADSDKSAGVVALTLFDLRRRGLVGKLHMAGTNGTKFPRIRDHFQACVGSRYRDLDYQFLSYPNDATNRDPRAYLEALSQLSPGDVVTVFTPDDTHTEIARAALHHDCHVLVAKPLVQRLADHRELARLAAERNLLLAVEMHKRWDPLYADARDRIVQLGEFGFFQSYMSQPKTQLETFRAWAGRASDISFYLNAHHIDFHVWSVAEFSRPRSVHAVASTGYAQGLGLNTEDTITLTATWENVDSGNLGTAIYTASWVAPPSDVHSQQRFFYMGNHGELQVDQAHRGYSIATDEHGYRSPNPLFMKYEPDPQGMFAGQRGYGYRSIADFVRAACEIRTQGKRPVDYRHSLALAEDTSWVTAILEAGRQSLDHDGAPVHFRYDASGLAGLEIESTR